MRKTEGEIWSWCEVHNGANSLGQPGRGVAVDLSQKRKLAPEAANISVSKRDDSVGVRSSMKAG